MNEHNLSDRRSFLRSVGAGLGLGLAGPVGALALPGGSWSGESPAKVRYRWVSVREIHGDGTHNAWPDICRWRGRYYVAFNSGGTNHGGGHGLLVLSSADGLNWETVLHKSPREWGVLENTTRTTVCPKISPAQRSADSGLLLLYRRRHGRQPETKGRSQTPLAEPEGIGGKASNGGSATTIRPSVPGSATPRTASAFGIPNPCWTRAGGSGGRRHFRDGTTSSAIVATDRSGPFRLSWRA